MHDQRNDLTPTEQEENDDSAVLSLLLSPAVTAQLSVDEVIREFGQRRNASDHRYAYLTRPHD